ncbi:MAG: DUF6268 family outer membrane beta-barrel protein [Limisphaerales bacterium]|jgi:hypothetical protein
MAAERRVTSSSTMEFAVVGDGSIRQGTIALGDMNTTFTRLRHVRSIPASETYSWRIGGEWERVGFGLPGASPLPNTLQSLHLHLGNTWRIGAKRLLQFEVDPGIYSDFEDVDLGDINYPVSARFIYAQNRNLQWVFALISNPKSELAFVGGVGARWRFAEDWTLDFILPKPQVRWDFSEELSIFAGGEFKGGAYRVAEDFGTQRGLARLNDSDITYREARVGAGFKWQFNQKFHALVDGGYLIDRRFSFEDKNLQLNGDGAPYFQISLRARY